MTAETIHACSYSCERPECIRAQRDELAARLTAETSNARGEWPERYACNEPEGTFWTDDAALANKLIAAAFDRDEWTVTDTQNPTAALAQQPAAADGVKCPWDGGSPCVEPMPAGMVYPKKPAPRASGYLDSSGVEWNAWDAGQMEAYARAAYSDGWEAGCREALAPAAPAGEVTEARMVGCERDDGTLNIHSENVYCAVCAPAGEVVAKLVNRVDRDGGKTTTFIRPAGLGIDLPPGEYPLYLAPQPAPAAVDDVFEQRAVSHQLMHWNGIPVYVSGTAATSSGNWPLIDAAARQENRNG